jgi:hypothetical protein
MAAATMRRALRDLCRENGVEFDPGDGSDLSAYFPFAPADVAAIHTSKHGAGNGLWFRLHDGRVFDKGGLPADDDPALYDAAPG